MTTCADTTYYLESGVDAANENLFRCLYLGGDTTHENVLTCSYWGGDTAKFSTNAMGRVVGRVSLFVKNFVKTFVQEICNSNL